jgi:hypothetical protein
MTDPSGLEAVLGADPGAPTSEARNGYPSSAGALLDRLGLRYGLEGEIEGARRATEPLAAVPLETSVSLRDGGASELRLTLGIPPRPGDPHARLALVGALSALGAGRVSAAVDDALARVAPPPERRRLQRGLALRARRGEPVRPRPSAWVGGETAPERSARVGDAMLGVGLDDAAAQHRRLAALLAANPFCSAIPYGLGFDVGPDRVLGAKTYFACEWADIATQLLGGRLADDLGLDGVEGFELLAASARADRRRSRWLLEVSFELPADPARGVRAKAYLPPSNVASTEAEGHAAVLRLAAQLGVDSRPYEELVDAVRPDGLTSERPCSLMVGLSASERGASLEVYLFDPGRSTSAATRNG